MTDSRSAFAEADLQTSPEGLAKQVAATMLARDRAARHLGIEVLEVGPGHARLRMPLREEMLNAHDIGHGGFIFALADTAFAYACNACNIATVASGCAIDYVAPAQAGDILIANATERSQSGRTGVYDVAVSNQKGETIALFRGRSYRLKEHVIREEG